MPRFERLRIAGFRRLLDLDLKLRPLMVLIGANGAGKSSFLDAWALLAHSATGKLASWMSEAGGIVSQITYDRTKEMRLILTLPAEGQDPSQYGLALKPQGSWYGIEEEYFRQQGESTSVPFYSILSKDGSIQYYNPDLKKLIRPTWDHTPLETALSQVPKMFAEPEKFRQILASSTYYHTLDVSPRAPVRLPQPMRPAALPGSNGEDLASCLFFLREAHRDRFEAIEDTLRSAYQGFERLDFPPAAAGVLSMTWKDRHFSHPLYSSQWSEGMLRFVWLITLLQSPGLTEVTMIDEPEVSLHPELLSLFVDLLREASRHSQVIVATHSDRLVRFLYSEEVCVFNISEDGAAQTAWGNEMDIDEWLKEYSLDELWRNGRIGGRS